MKFYVRKIFVKIEANKIGENYILWKKFGPRNGEKYIYIQHTHFGSLITLAIFSKY